MKLNFRPIFPRDAFGHAEHADALYLYCYTKGLEA